MMLDNHAMTVAASRRRAILSKAAAIAAVAVCAGWVTEAHAAPVTYVYGSGANWSTATWSPTGIGSIAAGDIATRTAAGAVNVALDTDVTLGQLYNSSANAWNVNSAAANPAHTLTLDNTGGDLNPVGSTNAFVGAIGAGTMQISYNTTIHVPTSTTLDIGTTSTGAFNMFQTSSKITGTGNLRFLANDAGNITVRNLESTGSVTNAGTGTGTVQIASGSLASITSITQNSATSTLQFANNNTITGFTGPITINAGTVDSLGTSSNNPLGTGLITLGATSGSADTKLIVRGNNTANPIKVQGGNTGTATLATQDKLTGGITLDNHDLTIEPVAQTDRFGAITGTGNIRYVNSVVSNNNNWGTFQDPITINGSITFEGPGTRRDRFTSTAPGFYLGSGVTEIIVNYSAKQAPTSAAGSNTNLEIGTNIGDFTGPLKVEAGHVTLNNANALKAANVLSIKGDAEVRQAHNGGVSIAGLSNGSDNTGGTYYRWAGVANTYSLTLAGTGTYSFDGTLTDKDATPLATTGFLGLIKSGSGTQTLTGDSNYRGATQVTGGTLIVDGSLQGSGNVTVGAGATLGGSGSIAGNTTVSGTLAPGSSPGEITFGGNLAMGNGSTLSFEGGDHVVVTGTLTLADNWTLLLGSGFEDGGSVVLYTYGVAGSLDLDPTILTSGLGFSPSGALTLSDTGSQIVLNGISAVPEPGSLLALAGGAGLMAMRRRRSRWM